MLSIGAAQFEALLEMEVDFRKRAIEYARSTVNAADALPAADLDATFSDTLQRCQEAGIASERCIVALFCARLTVGRDSDADVRACMVLQAAAPSEEQHLDRALREMSRA